ncbi:cysteine desulfurase [Vibrio chagasii]|nr:cysteine desulfurase [Vibrio chagasii]
MPPPWHGGNKVVERVSFSGTTFFSEHGKFRRAPNVAGAIALLQQSRSGLHPKFEQQGNGKIISTSYNTKLSITQSIG